jgi:hypothetical protein
MNIASLAYLALFSMFSGEAFQMLPMRNNAMHTNRIGLSMDNSNYSTESPASIDNYVFPSIQAQEMQEHKRGSLRKALKDAATTFAAYRELEAAGLISDGEAISKEEAKQKAAEKFATFAKRSQKELDAVNNGSTSNIPTVMESVLTQTAAVLGRKTGQIFGGNEPENYRD